MVSQTRPRPKLSPASCCSSQCAGLAACVMAIQTKGSALAVVRANTEYLEAVGGHLSRADFPTAAPNNPIGQGCFWVPT